MEESFLVCQSSLMTERRESGVPTTALFALSTQLFICFLSPLLANMDILEGL